ncbi:MAG: hypothetical protein PHH98_04050 [Candidatus Gracilibacteria bacterium]|nr:hypothetical protein [Candidatus Gracilibacteria bacterium]
MKTLKSVPVNDEFILEFLKIYLELEISRVCILNIHPTNENKIQEYVIFIEFDEIFSDLVVSSLTKGLLSSKIADTI